MNLIEKEEELKELINDVIGGRIDSVHLHNFMRQVEKQAREDVVRELEEKLPKKIDLDCDCSDFSSGQFTGWNLALAEVKALLTNK